MIWVVECFWGMQLQGESLYPVIWRRFQPPQCETSNRQCCSFKCCRSLGRWRKGPLIQISSDTVLEVFTEGMQLEIYLVALRPLQRRLLSVREAEKGSNDTDGGPSSYPGQRWWWVLSWRHIQWHRGGRTRVAWDETNWRSVQFCWPQSIIMWVKPEN